VPFVHRLRVRFHECDPQGVVFNAHYFSYFDVALTEMWRAAFGSYATVVQGGTDVVVVEAGATFRAPARFDDEVDVELAIERLGTTSISSSKRSGARYRIVASATTMSTPASTIA